ncbi:MAG TPA: hypothetical protein VGE46_02625 [Bdellovibrio sp.]
MMRLFSIFLITFTLVACKKPEPNPELKDPIYTDISASLESTSKAVEAEKKTLEGHIKALADVVPQTGQIKFAQKRVDESKAKIVLLEQEKRFLELKLATRLKISRKAYNQAFKTGETWPVPAEWDAYQAEKRLRSAKRNWDVKDRIKELSEPIQAPASGGGHH